MPAVLVSVLTREVGFLTKPGVDGHWASVSRAQRSAVPATQAVASTHVIVR